VYQYICVAFVEVAEMLVSDPLQIVAVPEVEGLEGLTQAAVTVQFRVKLPEPAEYPPFIHHTRCVEPVVFVHEIGV